MHRRQVIALLVLLALGAEVHADDELDALFGPADETSESGSADQTSSTQAAKGRGDGFGTAAPAGDAERSIDLGAAAPPAIQVPTQRAAQVDEIIVTAQKRVQPLFDVPMSVSAFSGATLEDMGADTLSDIAAATPGFSVSESGPGVQSLQIRGIASAFGKATVGYQLDNVSLTSFSDTQPDAATFDLQSVEILRGPQGTLYGEGSMGGTVKLMTRKPDYDGWAFLGQGGYFLTEGGDPSAELNLATNMPVAGNQAARLVLGYAELGGFVDQVELQRPNDNYNRKLNARLRYLWEPAARWSASVMVLAGDIEAGSSNAADENYEQSDKAPVGIDDASQAYSLDLNYAAAWADVLLTSSFFTREIFATFDAREGTVNSLSVEAIGRGVLGTSLPAITALEGPLQAIATDTVDAVPTFLSDQNDSFVSELRLNGSGSERIFWTAGVHVRQQNEAVRVAGEIGLTEGAAVPLADTTNVSDSLSTSLFGQFEYDWTPWLNMAVGARYFREDLEVEIAGQVYGQSTDSHDTLRFTAFTPRLTFSLRAPDQRFAGVDSAMAYLTYARGFRSGGANTRIEGDDSIKPTYDPDTLDSYELGGKLIFWDRLLTVESAVYYMQWKDVQVVVQEEGSQLLTSIANAGNTEGLGVDWNITLAPLPGLQLIHSGAYLETEYVTDTDSKYRGDPVDFVPPLQYSFALAYSRPLWGRWGMMARADYNYQDPSVQTSRSSGISFQSEAVRMANLRIGLETERWQIYVFGRNLLDNEGPTAPQPDDRQPRARPPSYGLQASFDFQ